MAGFHVHSVYPYYSSWSTQSKYHSCLLGTPPLHNHTLAAVGICWEEKSQMYMYMYVHVCARTLYRQAVVYVATAPPWGILSLPNRASVVVFSIVNKSQLSLSGASRGWSLTVIGDGRVLVHLPADGFSFQLLLLAEGCQWCWIWAQSALGQLDRFAIKEEVGGSTAKASGDSVLLPVPWGFSACPQRPPLVPLAV